MLELEIYHKHKWYKIYSLYYGVESGKCYAEFNEDGSYFEISELQFETAIELCKTQERGTYDSVRLIDAS